MRCVVTGSAGFIGSHLCEALAAAGHEVAGIDCFTPYYDAQRKRSNLAHLHGSPRFTFVEADLVDADLEALCAGADYIFHQAAQAGVRASWGTSFAEYTRHNVLATQRLLEAARTIVGLRKFVYASSSSIYGNVPLPMVETVRPQPISPYGVTKLAGEHLCLLYHHAYAVPTVALRYFTVYGPRQRPDMGIHKFIEAMLAGKDITVYGDGLQTRDFTFVADIVRANIAAAVSDAAGDVFNIGGEDAVVLRTIFELLERYIGVKARLVYDATQKGDVDHTGADTSHARAVLGYRPTVSVEEGLCAQVIWHTTVLHTLKPSRLPWPTPAPPTSAPV
jgi:UDP-glucose 4-epimerase